MSPEGFGGSPWYFDYPIRRCVTCVMPHMIGIVSVPTILTTFPVLRRVACQIGDRAIYLVRSAFPFPVWLCFKAFLPDDLKVS
jgi:hypothetical protein